MQWNKLNSLSRGPSQPMGSSGAGKNLPRCGVGMTGRVVLPRVSPSLAVGCSGRGSDLGGGSFLLLRAMVALAVSEGMKSFISEGKWVAHIAAPTFFLNFVSLGSNFMIFLKSFLQEALFLYLPIHPFITYLVDLSWFEIGMLNVVALFFLNVFLYISPVISSSFC